MLPGVAPVVLHVATTICSILILRGLLLLLNIGTLGHDHLLLRLELWLHVLLGGLLNLRAVAAALVHVRVARVVSSHLSALRGATYHTPIVRVVVLLLLLRLVGLDHALGLLRWAHLVLLRLLRSGHLLVDDLRGLLLWLRGHSRCY